MSTQNRPLLNVINKWKKTRINREGLIASNNKEERKEQIIELEESFN